MNIKDTPRWQTCRFLSGAYLTSRDDYKGELRDLLTEEEDDQVEELLRNKWIMSEVYMTCGANLRPNEIGTLTHRRLASIAMCRTP